MRFPRLGLVRFPKPENADGKPEWEDYDPGEALVRQQREDEDEAEFHPLQAELEAAYRQNLEAAKLRPPPDDRAGLSRRVRRLAGWLAAVMRPGLNSAGSGVRCVDEILPASAAR